MFKKLIFGITLVLLSIIGIQEAKPQTTSVKLFRLRSLSRPVSNIDYFLVQDMDDTTRAFKLRADSLKTYLGLTDSFYITMNLDSLSDGTTYAKVKSTNISAGNILISSATVWDDSLRPYHGPTVTRSASSPDSIFMFMDGADSTFRDLQAGDLN